MTLIPRKPPPALEDRGPKMKRPRNRLGDLRAAAGATLNARMISARRTAVGSELVPVIPRIPRPPPLPSRKLAESCRPTERRLASMFRARRIMLLRLKKRCLSDREPWNEACMAPLYRHWKRSQSGAQPTVSLVARCFWNLPWPMRQSVGLRRQSGFTVRCPNRESRRLSSMPSDCSMVSKLCSLCEMRRK